MKKKNSKITTEKSSGIVFRKNQDVADSSTNVTNFLKNDKIVGKDSLRADSFEFLAS